MTCPGHSSLVVGPSLCRNVRSRMDARVGDRGDSEVPLTMINKCLT